MGCTVLLQAAALFCESFCCAVEGREYTQDFVFILPYSICQLLGWWSWCVTLLKFNHIIFILSSFVSSICTKSLLNFMAFQFNQTLARQSLPLQFDGPTCLNTIVFYRLTLLNLRLLDFSCFVFTPFFNMITVFDLDHCWCCH